MRTLIIVGLVMLFAFAVSMMSGELQIIGLVILFIVALAL